MLKRKVRRQPLQSAFVRVDRIVIGTAGVRSVGQGARSASPIRLGSFLLGRLFTRSLPASWRQSASVSPP